MNLERKEQKTEKNMENLSKKPKKSVRFQRFGSKSYQWKWNLLSFKNLNVSENRVDSKLVLFTIPHYNRKPKNCPWEKLKDKDRVRATVTI